MDTTAEARRAHLVEKLQTARTLRNHVGVRNYEAALAELDAALTSGEGA